MLVFDVIDLFICLLACLCVCVCLVASSMFEQISNRFIVYMIFICMYIYIYHLAWLARPSRYSLKRLETSQPEYGNGLDPWPNGFKNF